MEIHAYAAPAKSFLLPVGFSRLKLSSKAACFLDSIFSGRAYSKHSGGVLQSVPCFQMKSNFPCSSTAMSKKLTYFSLIVDAPKAEFFFVFIINNLADGRISGL